MAARPRPSSDEAREALRDAMARLAAGDQTALEEIYRATRVKLFGICLRILGDRKEAEDALQDVYVNLWQRADRYDPTRASPIAWLVDAEQTAQIHKCLGALDARTQGHIRAAFFEGYTYAQLADAADVPLGTMKSWIRRGLQRLRACLEASEAA